MHAPRAENGFLSSGAADVREVTPACTGRPRIMCVREVGVASMLSPSQAAMYRRLTLGDDSLMTSLFSVAGEPVGRARRSNGALVRLAALVAVDADTPAYQSEVRGAISAGASPEQITAVLVVIARVAGSALVMSAAPKLALALGYDVDDGLEDASHAKER